MTGAERRVYRLPSCVESVSVASQADGDMVVHVAYNVKPIEPGATPVGVITRMEIARKMERILNKSCAALSRAAKEKKR